MSTCCRRHRQHVSAPKVFLNRRKLCLLNQLPILGVPRSLHLWLMLICQPVGAVASSFVILVHSRQIEALGINVGVAACGSFIIAVGAIRFLFLYVIRARCPICRCYLMYHGGRPISYRCSNCAYIHETTVSEGD